MQAHFLPALLINLQGQFVPDLTLLLVIVWALVLPWQWSLPLAFIGGLVFDLFNSPQLYPFGLNALLYTITALAISFINPQGEAVFSRGSGIARAVPVTLITILVYRLLLLIVERVLGYNSLQIQILIQVVLPAAIINAALMLILYGPLRLLSRVGVPRDII